MIPNRRRETAGYNSFSERALRAAVLMNVGFELHDSARMILPVRRAAVDPNPVFLIRGPPGN